MGKQWKPWQTLFYLFSKITADGGCSQKIKRRLLLGRKAMTNLDSVLKSRDITLLTNFHLVETTVSPRVMYGCESGTIKKAEGHRIDAFELWYWRRLLESPLDCKEIQPVYPKGKSVLNIHWKDWCWSWISNTLATWCEELTHWKRLWCLVSQSCLILWETMDCSPLGSSVHGLLQARILEWVAISFSRGSSWPRDRTCVSCIGRWIFF